MALVVQIFKGSIPIPHVVTPETVVQKSGEPNALGITLPKINTDMSGVHFKLRAAAGGGEEFSFDYGTMKITLSQEVYLASDLTVCEIRKWSAHERLHVEDNRAVMDNLEAEFMTYGTIQEVFVSRTWYPRADFQTMQQAILDEVGLAFVDLTAAAATARDTHTEYQRVCREILRDCPAPIMYTIQPRDNLSQIALHYYGAASKWKKIYDANKAKIGGNPNQLRVGDKIEIPKEP